MIYIDNPKVRSGRRCAHMVADTLVELHEFAIVLGLHRRYFQSARKHPHYDLWGFPLEQVINKAKRKDGVVIASDKELVIISHSLINQTNNHCHGKSKNRL